MKGYKHKIGAVVVSAALVLSALIILPKAKKVSADTTPLMPDIPANAEWVEVQGRLKNGNFESLTSDSDGTQVRGNNVHNKGGTYNSNSVTYIKLEGRLICKDKLTVQQGTVYLDLFGNELKSDTAKAMIDVKPGSKLYIFDSKGNGRVYGNSNYVLITTVNYQNSGTTMGDVFFYSGTLLNCKGAVEPGPNGKFTMYGGTITGSVNAPAINVHDTNTVEILGGTITGNTTGIYKNGGTLNVKGNVNITGNVGDNVYLASGNVINVTGELTGEIGVTTATAPTVSSPVPLTTGLSGNGSSTVFSSDKASCYIEEDNGEAVLQKSVFAGCRLILTGNIGVRYYLDLDSVDQGSGTKVTFNGADVAFNLANHEPINGVDYYYFDIQVNAAQMAVDISPVATLAGSNKTETLKTFSVRDVAEAIINGDDDADTKALAAAMLDYGTRVQNYFGVSGAMPADQVEDLSGLTTDLLDYNLYSGAVTGADQNLYFYGSSMLTLSRSSLRLYFKVADQQKDKYAFSHGLTPEYAPNTDSYYCYVVLTDIAPTAYDDEVTVAATWSGSDVISVTYSPLNYCARVVQENQDSSLVALALSMYNYHLKAEAYNAHH